MVVKPLKRYATLDIRKWSTEQELQPMITQMNKKMSSMKQTIASLIGSSSEVSGSIELQGFLQHNLIITTTLAIVIPLVGPHSQSKPTIPKAR